jgi:hypothetical protein
MRTTTSSVPLCNVEERRRAVSLGSNGQAKSRPPATSSTAVRKSVVNPRYLTGWRGCHRAGERSNPSVSSGESGRFDATDLMAENKGSGDPGTHRHGTSSSDRARFCLSPIRIQRSNRTLSPKKPDFVEIRVASSPTSSPVVRYWNMARQRYYRPSARCCRALCVSADRAARPSLNTAENRGFST